MSISAGDDCTGIAGVVGSVTGSKVYVSCRAAVGIAGCARFINTLVWSSGTGIALDGACAAGALVQNDTIFASTAAIVIGAGPAHSVVQNTIVTGPGIGIDARAAAAALTLQNDVAFGLAAEVQSATGVTTLALAGQASFTEDPHFVDMDGADNDMSTWADNNWSVGNVAATCDVREGGIVGPATDILGVPRTAQVVCHPANGGVGITIGAYEVD
jgi:hypothetical protein